MGRTIIGAVWIVLESEGGAFAADASVQEPPKALVVELREIGHRILSRSNCGALCGADAGRRGKRGIPQLAGCGVGQYLCLWPGRADCWNSGAASGIL